MPTLIGDQGVRLGVHELGGEGPDLLLAHATGFHGRAWRPVADVLGASFRCVAFDSRGHGESSLAQNGSLDWHDLAQDVLAVVDGMALQHPYAVGHSSGAALLLLAEEARPGTFEGLYCFEPIVAPVDGPAPPDPERPLAVRARRRRDVFPSRREALAYFADRPAFRSLASAALQAYVDHGFEDLDDGSVRLKCRPETEGGYYEHGLAHNGFRHLGRVQCPVVLACGQETDAVGPEVLELLAGRLGEARIETFPSLGHFGPLEDPGAVALAVERAFSTPSLIPGPGGDE